MIIIARIRQIIDGLLAYVQSDYEALPEEQTFLYHMFYGTKDRNFDFYQKAKELFLRRNTSPRKLRTVLEYPLDKSHLPCIVIREPARKQVMMRLLAGMEIYLLIILVTLNINVRGSGNRLFQAFLLCVLVTIAWKVF